MAEQVEDGVEVRQVRAAQSLQQLCGRRAAPLGQRAQHLPVGAAGSVEGGWVDAAGARVARLERRDMDERVEYHQAQRDRCLRPPGEHRPQDLHKPLVHAQQPRAERGERAVCRVSCRCHRRGLLAVLFAGEVLQVELGAHDPSFEQRAARLHGGEARLGSDPAVLEEPEEPGERIGVPTVCAQARLRFAHGLDRRRRLLGARLLTRLLVVARHITITRTPARRR